VKACALLSALTVGSCSVLLDWNGYTGGSASSHPDASVGGDDSRIQDDAEDVAVGSNDAQDAQDAQDARGPEDATNDVADARDASGLQDADSSAAPMCSSAICGGCCVQSRNFCSGGNAPATCGVGGEMCSDCTGQGLACIDGQCVSPPADAGRPGPCVEMLCANLHQCITINNFQMPCCRSDNFCGCQIVFDPTHMCI
jgi:hypothetical protein